MGKASKFNIGRMKIVWIFFWCGHEKMLKIDFFHKTPIPRNLLKEKNIRARSMWNLTSWRFRKCRTYWACELLNESYWPSKMEESEKIGPSSKIRGVTKKRHGHNFEFWGLKRIAYRPNHVRRPCYSFQTSKLDIVAVSFFFNASYFRGRTSFFGLVHLWRPITPVQNLTRPISSTFSETSGREV